MNIGVISYATAAALFLLLFVLLLTSWRGRLQGGLITAAIFISAIWALSAAYVSAGQPLFFLVVLENLRNLAWFVFMLGLLKPVRYPTAVKWAIPVFVSIVLLMDLFPVTIQIGQSAFSTLTGSILGHLIQAIIGLSLMEQLFRNTPSEQRWAVKHLFLGIGCLFAYDFYLYADTLLFKQTDPVLWQVRGFINAIAVPLIAVSAARNPAWDVQVSVSRTAAFNLTAVFGASLYLLVMASVGYYIRAFEGTWSNALQVAFLFLAILLLLVLALSHSLRVRLSVFLNKHFFRNKYDYREEWLKLLDALGNKGDDPQQLQQAAIQALTQIVTSERGSLWLLRAQNEYQCVASWHTAIIEQMEPVSGSLVTFLKNKRYVINLHDYPDKANEYTELELPVWLQAAEDVWLIVPLLQQEALLGFIAIGKPIIKRDINWEDRDFLIAAGRHIAGYLALQETSEALTQARQFEAFNRLSAFVVHDLKNVAAQLGLISSNAKNHKHNQEFMDDALSTVDNAVNKMHRMLSQLRQERVSTEQKETLDLVVLLQQIVEQRSATVPVPTLTSSADHLLVCADRDRLEAVLLHLIQNAQEATESTGKVDVSIRADEHRSVIEIADNGIGMDAAFIRDRLFKPFDTTKGNAGMGIGVYEGREFVHSLRGRIDVSSTPGQGTIFTIKLPSCIQEPLHATESIHIAH